MYLLKSWVESLKFFIPRNFKLFFLVTLKRTYEAYRVWIKYFLVFFVISAAIGYFVPVYYPFPYWQFKAIFRGFVFRLTLLITTFVLFLAIRPSTKRKNLGYFWSYRLHFLLWFLLLVVWALLSTFFIVFIEPLRLGSNVFIMKLLWPFEKIIRAVCYPFLILKPLKPFLYFFAFFFLDAKGKIKSLFLSLGRAGMMFFYNAPFCLIIAGLFGLLNYGSLFVEFKLQAIIPFHISMWVRFFLFAPIAIALFSNFYTKRLHDQFALYFKK